MIARDEQPKTHSSSRNSAYPSSPVTARAIRVLHVLPQFAYGGTELVVCRLVSGLDPAEFAHHVCAMRGFDPNIVSGTRLEGRVLQVGHSSERFQFPLVPLVRAMRSLRPDIVHTRNWGALEAVLAARIARVPVVIHSEHGYDLDMLRGLPWRRRILRKGFYALTDALFAVSDELRSYHAQQAGLSKVRFRLLYNGVDTVQFAPRRETRAAVRDQLGIPQNSVVIGSVGRMVAVKDYPLTMRAVGNFAKNRDIHLLLVGSGPELPALQQIANQDVSLQGRVHFCGFSDNVAPLLNTMDIFVQASRAEGMSNTLLEAMASGLPLLATDVGGNPEVVKDGEVGWLFAPGDTPALARHIDALTSFAELRDRMGTAGRQRALQYFSVDRMLSEYRDLYRQLAARRGVIPVV